MANLRKRLRWLLVWCLGCCVLSAHAQLSQSDFREYAKRTWHIADEADTALDALFGQGWIPNSSVPWKEVIGGLIAGDEVLAELNNGNHDKAARAALKYGADLYFSHLLAQIGLSGPVAVANLAAAPLQWWLLDFYNYTNRLGFDSQCRLYIKAREIGMTHQQIVNRDTFGERVFYTDEGWLYYVDEMRAGWLVHPNPTEINRDLCVSLSQRVYDAKFALNGSYASDKAHIGDRLREALRGYAAFKTTPANPSAPQRVVLDATATRPPQGATVTAYLWTSPGGGTSTASQITRDLFNPGEPYTFTLRATFSDNTSSTITGRVAASKPRFDVVQSNSDSRDVVFRAPASPLVSEWRWEFGDGRTATGREVAHFYDDYGRYEVRLTVRATNGVEHASDPVEVNTGFAGPTFLAGGTITGHDVWRRGSSPYVVTQPIHIAEGGKLTIEAGVVVKFAQNVGLSCAGELLVNGEANRKVTFTSIYDHSVGGDVYGDGQSGAYRWNDLVVQQPGRFTINHAEMRHCRQVSSDSAQSVLHDVQFVSRTGPDGTWSFPDGIVLRRGGVVSDCTFTDLSQGLSMPELSDSDEAVVSGSSFLGSPLRVGSWSQGLTTAAIESCRFVDAYAAFTGDSLSLRLVGNTFETPGWEPDRLSGVAFLSTGELVRAEVSGNSHEGGVRSLVVGGYWSASMVTISGDVSWQKQPGLFFRFSSHAQVLEGASLALGPGLVLGFGHTSTWDVRGHTLIVHGVFASQGTTSEPVLLTHSLDAQPFGGGPPPTANVAPWGGLLIRSTSPTAGLSHLRMRYASGWNPNYLFTGLASERPLSLDRCEFGTSDGQWPTSVTLAGGSVARNCDFLGGLSASSPTVDAKWNWWGHNSGPYHPTMNPNGQGSYVSDNVLFHPWLTRGRPVDGAVAFQDFVGDRTAVPVTIELRQPGTTTRVDGQVVYLSSSGAFTFNTELVGTYDIVARAPRFLRAKATNVVIGEQGVTNLSFSLVNGDVNGDNTVSIQDFLLVRQAFGSSAGGPGWNPNADLNGDGSVGIADFLILRRNFGRQGQD